LENKTVWEFIPTVEDYKGEEDMTSKEVEVKLTSVEKSVEEMRDAVRRLFQENSNNLSLLSKVSEELNKLKAEVSNLKTDLKQKEKAQSNLGRTNY
jgi:septation ring formation regulator EzrA